MSSDQKLTDEAVIQMREEVRSGHGKLQRDYADLYGVTREMIAKAIRGQTFKHLNKEHPPFKTVNSKDHLKEQVLSLYKQGNSYNAIVKMLDISKSTVSVYCRHLRKKEPNLVREKKVDLNRIAREESKLKTQQMYLDGYTQREIAEILEISPSTVLSYCKPVQGQERKERIRPRKEGFKPSRLLTNQMVIDMRNQVRETGVRNLKYWSEKYNINLSSISYALNGRTYKYLNDVCPPVTGKLPLYGRNPAPKRKPLSPELIEEIIRLRKEDSLKWTFLELSLYVSKKTERSYMAGHIAILIRRRAPELKELEEIKPPPRPRVFREPRPKKERTPKPPREKKAKAKPSSQYHEHECVVCENRFKSLDPDAEVCWREECIAVIENYEKEHEDA